MTTLSIQPPFPPFADRAGAPLQNGYIWIGTAALNPITNPIAVYWDAALTQAAAQPIRTQGGYPVNNGTPARLYVGSDYSILVQDNKGTLVYQSPNATERWSDVVVNITSADIEFLQAGTGASPRTVESKLRDGVNALDFGADPTGLTDSTTALRNLLDYCIPAKKWALIPGGTYAVSGPLTNLLSIASGELNIECVGDVTINVSGSTPATSALISCYTTSVNNSTICGGRLTLNLNNRIACGIYLRHGASTSAGSVDWGPITVTNTKELGAAVVNETQALLVYGRYTRVTLRDTVVDGVDRTNTTGGACKGISISEIDGPTTLHQPQVSRVICTGGTADADGIAIFGRTITTANGRRGGTVQIIDPVVTDCQGRSIKLQTTDAEIVRPRVFRQAVVSIASGADLDSQIGGAFIVSDPVFEYRDNSGTSPLGASFTPFSIQQTCTDVVGHQCVNGGVIRTEVQIPRLMFVTVGASALDGHTELIGLDVQATGGLAGSVVSRAVVEFDAGQVAASTGKTHIIVQDVRGNFSNYPLLGYTSYGSSVATKLSWDVRECTNIGSTESRVFAAVSGSNIPEVSAFMLRDNAGCVDSFASWTFDYASLQVGCIFAYDIATSTATNKPAAMAASGVAVVEVLGGINTSGGRRTIRATVGDASAANSVFFTQYPAGGWGAIK